MAKKKGKRNIPKMAAGNVTYTQGGPKGKDDAANVFKGKKK